jgi:hypothetical protein
MYIITTNDTMNIIGQFIAFYIIADLDTIYFRIIAQTSMKEQLNDEAAILLTKVHYTTSIDARMQIEQNAINDMRLGVPRHSFGPDANLPTYIGLNFSERSWENKLLYSCYRVVKCLFISFWYYFAPFYALYSYLFVFFV